MNEKELDFFDPIKAPVATRLADILALLPKSRLKYMAYRYYIKGRSKMNAEALIAAMASHMAQPAFLQNALLPATRSELNMFKKLLETPFIQIEKFHLSNINHLRDSGILFVFRHESSIRLVLPDEMKDSWRAIDHLEFMTRNRTIAEVYKYMLAMTNLYGAFEIDMAYEIINSQRKTPLSKAEFINALYWSASRGNYFRLKAGKVISEYYSFNDSAEEMEAMLRERRGKPFFIPGCTELLKYSDQFYENAPDQFQALKVFFKKYFKLPAVKFANLTDEIRVACSMGESVHDIFEITHKYDVEFTSQAQVSEFLPILTNLINNSRMWVNGGHTPAELSLLRAGPKLNTIAGGLATKVGRNDLCPCGSGKKYKNCCGLN